jgi:diguanylate cyclase (GGDEF)-like protein
MRHQFRNATLGTKLKAINLLAVTLVVVFSMLSISVVLYQRLMNDHQHNLGNLTRVLGDNLNATLVFADAKNARATLEGLAQAEDIVYAGLYDASGKLFASYNRAAGTPAVPLRWVPEQLKADTALFRMNTDYALTLTAPGDTTTAVGTLVLRQSLTNAYRQLWVLLGVLLLTSMAVFALLTWLLGRLQRQITQPLVDLTGTMQRIQQGGDLTGRAQIATDDEIGELAQGFNHLMTELQQRDDEKNVARMRFESVLKAVPDLMFEMTRGGKYLNVWGVRGDLLAAPKPVILGRNVEDVLPLAAAQEALQAIQEADQSASGHSFGRQIKLDLPIGEHWFELSVAKSHSLDSQEASFVVMSRDITERRKAEDEIRQLAFYDVLTQLPNRRLLMDRLQTALAFSARTRQWGAILFLDMDRFKTINDTLGHDHGDMLLLEAAKRIQSCLREADTVARVGGDEFVIVLDELDTDTDAAARKAAQVAEKIRCRLAEPYQLNAHERYSSPSIGVCMYLGAQVAAQDLIKNADVAMYQAKGDGRNLVRFFDLTMQQSVEARALMDAELRHCVLEQQLRLYYQIQVDQRLRPLGAEALVRWFHPRRGMVPPAHFIGIAEESNLIIEIGNWVLDTACKQLQLWAGCPQTQALTLAVNVSAQQFKQPQFVDLVTRALSRHQVNPKRLKLELTESVILGDVTAVISKMHTLKTLGVGLSLDDFGTGYSSLAYLKQLPLDQIKIDQSFVRDLETDASDAVMVRTIIDLAKNFNLNVIAEGVETPAQLNFLTENGCPAFQGYYFGKPVPIEEFEKLLLQTEVPSVTATE